MQWRGASLILTKFELFKFTLRNVHTVVFKILTEWSVCAILNFTDHLVYFL